MDDKKLKINAKLQQETFDRLAENWDENVKHDIKLVSAILEITGLRVGERILDIAGGTGILTPLLLAYKPKELTLLDISEKMLEKAKQKFGENENIHFLNEDFYNLDEGPKYDYLICFDAFPHFTDREAFAEKLNSLTRRGGRFVICHDQSRETINNRHKGKSEISSSLKPIREEAKRFKKYFNVDILVDSDRVFVLSGIKPKDQPLKNRHFIV